MGRATNNYTSSTNLPLGGRSNLSVNNFPTLPPLPSMPPGMSSLSNYSLSRAPGSNLNNSNYYHLGGRLGERLNGGGNYHMMDNNPYNTTLSVPLAQGLTPAGYNGARVSYDGLWTRTVSLTMFIIAFLLFPPPPILSLTIIVTLLYYFIYEPSPNSILSSQLS